VVSLALKGEGWGRGQIVDPLPLYSCVVKRPPLFKGGFSVFASRRRRLLLAVHVHELGVRITAAGGDAWRECFCECREMRIRQFHIKCAERLGQPLAPTRAD